MNHDIPDTKAEAPEFLRVFMQHTRGFESTPEEVEEYKRFLTLSPEDFGSELYSITDQTEEIARELAEAQDDVELNKTYTELWRELAVCTAAGIAKQIRT